MILMMKAQKAILSLFQTEVLIDSSAVWNYLQLFSDKQYVSINIDIPVKHSQYNIEKHNGNTYLIYNTLFSSMITLSDSEFIQYKNLNFSDLDIVEALIDNGFMIPEFINEFERYEYYRHELEDKYSSSAHYTIALTTKCNARCIYCYEEGIDQYDMSFETAEKLANLLCQSEKEINITWFGGEPLIKTDLIGVITEILHKNDKAFKSDIITNGSLLTESMIQDKFQKWGVEFVQITLDGMAEEYLRRKCYYRNKKDVFEAVIKNIDSLIESGIYVDVRLNTDSENREECMKVTEYLKNRCSSNPYLNVYPSFLSGKSRGLVECERINYTDAIYKIYPPESGLLKSVPKITPCFFQQEGAFVIDTDGSILCCDRDIGKRHTKIADIDKITNFDLLKKPTNIIPVVRNQCKHCVYYPKCGGGCSAAYSSQNSQDACFMEKYKIECLLNKIIKF
ncbi:MAG: radical SAM protein [Lachnospiraceae bacterium]|nr:radical SAM protein [Lachnospiraceae bacterium]